MKIMHKAAPGQEVTLEQIVRMQTGSVSRSGLGCAGVLLVVGIIWAMAGVCSLFVGTALNFFAGVFILLLAGGVLYACHTVLKDRKQRMNVDVRLSVQECRCVEFEEDNDSESSSTFAIFQNAGGARWRVFIPDFERKTLENRQGYLVGDDAHREVVMFFPKDIWQRTSQGFLSRF